MDETPTDPVEPAIEEETPVVEDTETGEETPAPEEEAPEEVDSSVDPVQGTYMSYPGGMVTERYMTQ